MWRSAIPCAVVLSAVAAVPVRADVLEIGPTGATWIAGGPTRASTDGAENRASQDAPLLARAVPTAVPAAWRSRVAELAAKYDLSPTLIEALVWQESRWNAGAVSPVGARGLAQLMPGTAHQLRVDPLDPASNLEGGARYLRMQLDAFDGDMAKALAAYNAGAARVEAAGGIPRIRETQNYVAAIMTRLSYPVRR